MKSVEQGILFGPFKTDHHAQTVDERFRKSFFSFVEKQVLPEVDGDFVHVEGRVNTHFDDLKYFGPLSVVKHRYFYEMTFHSPEGTETARGEIDYDPASAVFAKGRLRPPHVDSLSAQRKREDIMEKVASIADRYRAGERDLACPYCGCPLSIWYLEDRKFLKDISCPTKDCFRVHFD